MSSIIEGYNYDIFISLRKRQINQDRDLRREKAVYDHEAFLHLEEVKMAIAKLK